MKYLIILSALALAACSDGPPKNYEPGAGDTPVLEQEPSTGDQAGESIFTIDEVVQESEPATEGGDPSLSGESEDTETETETSDELLAPTVESPPTEAP